MVPLTHCILKYVSEIFEKFIQEISPTLIEKMYENNKKSLKYKNLSITENTL